MEQIAGAVPKAAQSLFPPTPETFYVRLVLYAADSYKKTSDHSKNSRKKKENKKIT
jgi:hypothetical protein